MTAFDEIYNAAVSADTKKLKSLISTHSINSRQVGQAYLTPAGRCALEGRFDACERLIALGASIHKIARGAAIGGHEAYAEKLRAEGANIDCIAQGAAIGGHETYAETLRTQGADIDSIAWGAAIGAHEVYAEKLRAQGADIDFIAEGAAEGGHETYAETLRAQGADIDSIAWGAAIGAHEVYAETLRAQGASINYIAQGAANGGHEAYAETIRAQGASINCIAQGAAIGGHEVYAEMLRAQGASIHSIAKGAAVGGHEVYAEKLRAQGADIHCIAEGAATGEHLQYIKKLQLSYLVEQSSSLSEVGSHIKSASHLMTGNTLDKSIIKKAKRIISSKPYGVSQEVALSTMRPNNEGATLLWLSVMNGLRQADDKAPCHLALMPAEILIHIFSFLGFPFSSKQSHALGKFIFIALFQHRVKAEISTLSDVTQKQEKDQKKTSYDDIWKTRAKGLLFFEKRDESSANEVAGDLTFGTSVT